MLILQITNVKEFMHKLLCTDTFDHFLLSEATIKGNGSYVVDGRPVAGFYTREEEEELGICGLPFLPFSLLRENCFLLIRGSRTPAAFQFVFQLTPDNLARTLQAGGSGLTLQDISAACLTIRFQDGMLTCTAGISYRSFITDHTFDREWDALVQRFFNSRSISYQKI